MKVLISFLRLKSGAIIIYLLLLMIFNVGFFLYDVDIEVFLYLDLLAIILIVPYLVLSFFRYKRHIEVIKAYKDFLEGDIDHQRCEYGEELYLSIIKDLKSKLDREDGLAKKHDSDIIDYFSLWVHQIKTPIAALKMLISDSDDKRLEIELLKIEDYVEMVLSYLKTLDSGDDFVFKMVDLDSVIKEEIKYFSAIFIYKKITVSYTSSDKQVLSDEKWLAFIIGQILSNALKYTKNDGQINIYLDGDVLYIEDDGIGIAAEDLPLIFERGYSGTVGPDTKELVGSVYISLSAFVTS